jgi:antitoxin YefM
MKTITAKEFSNNIERNLQEIEDDADFLVISRAKKKRKFVVLPQSEYESLKETSYLLSSPANAKRILKSIKEVEQGRIIRKDLKIK